MCQAFLRLTRHKATKAPVEFDHATHKQDCKVCHHKWDGSSPIAKCSAAGCHTSLEKKDKKKKDSFYNAYHGVDPQADLEFTGLV